MGEKGDSLLFLQPVEIDYLKDLEKHGVMLTEHPLLRLLGSFPLYNLKHQVKKFVSIDMHPWLLTLERAVESCISSEVCNFLLTVCIWCMYLGGLAARFAILYIYFDLFF